MSDDVERAAGTGRIALPRAAAQAVRVHGEQLARRTRPRLLVAVEDDVEREVDAGAGRDRAYVVVHGVALA